MSAALNPKYFLSSPSHLKFFNPACVKKKEKTLRATSSESNCVFLCLSLFVFFLHTPTHTLTCTHTVSAVLIKASQCVRPYRCVATLSKPAPCGGHRPGSWCAKPLVLRHLNRSIWASLSPPFLAVSFLPTLFTTFRLAFCPHGRVRVCVFMNKRTIFAHEVLRETMVYWLALEWIGAMIQRWSKFWG